MMLARVFSQETRTPTIPSPIPNKIKASLCIVMMFSSSVRTEKKMLKNNARK